MQSLHTPMRDAVHCHFDEGARPHFICLPITREEAKTREERLNQTLS
jgi:hypothetical protein